MFWWMIEVNIQLCRKGDCHHC